MPSHFPRDKRGIFLNYADQSFPELSGSFRLLDRSRSTGVAASCLLAACILLRPGTNWCPGPQGNAAPAPWGEQEGDRGCFWASWTSPIWVRFRDFELHLIPAPLFPAEHCRKAFHISPALGFGFGVPALLLWRTSGCAGLRSTERGTRKHLVHEERAELDANSWGKVLQPLREGCRGSGLCADSGLVAQGP